MTSGRAANPENGDVIAPNTTRSRRCLTAGLCLSVPLSCIALVGIATLTTRQTRIVEPAAKSAKLGSRSVSAHTDVAFVSQAGLSLTAPCNGSASPHIHIRKLLWERACCLMPLYTQQELGLGSLEACPPLGTEPSRAIIILMGVDIESWKQ